MKSADIPSYSLRGESISEPDRQSLCDVLRKGGVALLPTDTGYCYVGSSHVHQVRKDLLRLRHAHPKSKPFTLICSDIARVAEISHLSTPHYRMMKRLLPGPFTCVLERHKKTPITAVTEKGKTVGVRVPDSALIQELLGELEHPLLATSVTDAEELELERYYEDFHSPDSWWAHAEEIILHAQGLLSAVVDYGGPLPMRASTIFDFTQDPPRLLRDGGWDLTRANFDYVSEPV